jgi:beta-N-acetylhexosaminidase
MRKIVLLTGIFLLGMCELLVANDFQHPAQVALDRAGKNWAQKTLKRLSLQEKIGQLFMIKVLGGFVNSENPDYLKWRDQITRYHVGSVLLTVPSEGSILRKTEPYEAAMLINQLQRDSKLPLIVAADFERGPSMRLDGVTIFPHAMAFAATKNPDFARRFGEIVAEESRAVGVQWNFFPDADVNSNPANPIINVRSFGEDPEQVSAFVDAYIKGAREQGLLTTAKHFPGHGDTAADSHIGVATVNRSRREIEDVDLVPFRNAIKSGVDAIMVAHVTAPALEVDSQKVATTSPAIITGILRSELGFQGIIATDALDMGALGRLYPQAAPEAAGRAAVDAIKAGNDVLVLPSDLDGAYSGVLNAVRSGEISEPRIDEAVLKILQAKASVGLNKARLVDVNAISSVVAKPESLAFAQQVADSAITLVRDNGHVLPLRRQTSPPSDAPLFENSLVCILLVNDARSENGRQLERDLRSRVPGMRAIYVDPSTAAALTPEIQGAAASAAKVIVAAYVTPVAGGSSSTSLAPGPAALLNSVLKTAAAKTLVISFGSPYIAMDFPTIQNYLCAYSDVAIGEHAAAKALFGEMPIEGHLPVTIPGFAARGAGLQKPMVAP